MWFPKTRTESSLFWGSMIPGCVFHSSELKIRIAVALGPRPLSCFADAIGRVAKAWSIHESRCLGGQRLWAMRLADICYMCQVVKMLVPESGRTSTSTLIGALLVRHSDCILTFSVENDPSIVCQRLGVEFYHLARGLLHIENVKNKF